MFEDNFVFGNGMNFSGITGFFETDGEFRQRMRKAKTRGGHRPVVNESYNPNLDELMSVVKKGARTIWKNLTAAVKRNRQVLYSALYAGMTYVGAYTLIGGMGIAAAGTAFGLSAFAVAGTLSCFVFAYNCDMLSTAYRLKVATWMKSGFNRVVAASKLALNWFTGLFK